MPLEILNTVRKSSPCVRILDDLPKSRCLIKITLLFLVNICRVVGAQETPFIYSEGSISSNSVLPPPGTFLLIRSKDELCAIKFQEMWRGNDAGQSNAFRSGDESFRARYDWYLAERNTDGWAFKVSSKSGRSELEHKRLVGLGRFAFGTGNIRINCGSIAVKWTAPAHVYFFYGAGEDQGHEIAITNWRKIEDVNPNDGGLKWLRYEKNREKIYLR